MILPTSTFSYAMNICSQGTCLRREQELLHTSYSFIAGFHVISAGYSKSSNKKAGVTIAINGRFFRRKQLRAIAFPTEPCLAGRALAIRAVRRKANFSITRAYIAPGLKACGVVHKTCDWLSLFCYKCPRRSLPILSLDANAHTDLIKGLYNDVPINSSSIGPYNSEVNNFHKSSSRTPFMTQMTITE